jgi:hypothetical protein
MERVVFNALATDGFAAKFPTLYSLARVNLAFRQHLPSSSEP